MPTITHLIDAPRVAMGDIFLHQPLPYRGLNMVDPFLLIHHWDDVLPGGQHQSTVGVGPHPHRGFSPVTLVFNGGVHHRDTIGNDGVVYAGGTQWMNAGSGLVHSERPDKAIAEGGGRFELIQFWVNSPSTVKMAEPSYQPLSAEDTPSLTYDGGKAKVGVVNGSYGGKKGPIQATSDMLILRAELQAGANWDLNLPKGHNALVYQLDGELLYDGTTQAGARNMAVFEPSGGVVEIQAVTDARLIVLTGAAIDEPVATYGPFVMNTQREIVDALNDYQNGKLGHLQETFE